jgi:hypothetical protein
MCQCDIVDCGATVCLIGKRTCSKRECMYYPFITSEGTKLIWVILNSEGTSQIFSKKNSTKNSAKDRVFHDSSTASELLPRRILVGLYTLSHISFVDDDVQETVR